MAAELTGSVLVSPLAVTAASEAAAATNAALQEPSSPCPGGRPELQGAGDVLDTTRQAAFQRFRLAGLDRGPASPCSAPCRGGPADRAIDLFAGNVVEGRWEAATKDFTPQMLEHVDACLRIADAYAQTVSMVGGFERMG